MQFRLRTLMIVLALGLILLEFGLATLPLNTYLQGVPGEHLVLAVLLLAFWLGIPIAVAFTLATAVVLHFLPDEASTDNRP